MSLNDHTALPPTESEILKQQLDELVSAVEDFLDEDFPTHLTPNKNYDIKRNLLREKLYK
jgi:hypothetical protein